MKCVVDGVGEEIARELAERIMVMDGAMGTMLQKRKLEEEDFRGACVCVCLVTSTCHGSCMNFYRCGVQGSSQALEGEQRHFESHPAADDL